VEIGLLIAQDQAGTLIPTLGPEPTPTVAITIVPTKSTGSTTLLFNQAKAQMEGQDWEGLYTTLSAMREIDPAYKAVEVDGMWYLALRNRGIWQIQNGHLEPGMYSFALAKQIAPLDADAESYQEWARMYLNAGSNWMVDWYSAVQGFATLYPAGSAAAGRLRDHGYTALFTGINWLWRLPAGKLRLLRSGFDLQAGFLNQRGTILSGEDQPGR